MNRPKVLYVEDEQFLGKIVKDTLEGRGFEVQMATDGLQALQLLEKFTPEICVLDIMLPKMDGYTLAQEIRKQHANLPILFLTAKTQTEDLLKGFELGGNDYVRKPFSLEELLARINNLLQMAGQKANLNPNGNITIGKYEFSPQRYELRLGESVRKLSHRETELLDIFANNQNKVVNRQDILLRVWNDDSFFNSRNLDVYITRIRAYLKEDDTIQIVSIKGVGYHFLVG
jgi:DNA-binding response OmpR family regulator